ncbi:transmembrane amino acid transporter protein-domain-containing protein [Mycotypha africana]|uniref:transmembrane amino acid transporter protein-domain-containing protein n=1 Tax=Mycotypha africana TaxID=64632 RepID=UPI0023001D8D|nr:transmembrane amino acid transporter protein-domain-containing protein [Mycotypha africana]KAI8967759.1 transmembrane amino acid transporter protein-domain-containing protein [Mycotypha africana]
MTHSVYHHGINSQRELDAHNLQQQQEIYEQQITNEQRILPPNYNEFEFEDNDFNDTQEEPLLQQLGRRDIDEDQNSYCYNSDEESDTIEQKSYKLPSDGGTIFSSFLNMANSIIGAGIIGLPFAFKEAGFWTGIVFLVVITVIVDWTVRLLVFNGKLAGRSTYQDLMEFSFGRPGLIAISIFQFAFAFGGMCAYCVIIGDTIPHVIRSLYPSIVQTPVLWIFGDRKLCISFFTLVVSYPLSLYRDISKLAKTSALALIAIIVIIIGVAIEGPRTSLEIRGSSDLMFNVVHNEVFQAIAVISFAFVCHHNSFLIFGSLKQPSLNRFAIVTHWSMAIAFFACFALAVFGYVIFTDKTAGNILNNFPSDNFLINIARLAFGLNMFTTIPLEAFVCREVLETFYWPNSPFDKTRHFLITTALILITLTISLLTCNLGIVLELTGAFSATVLAFVLPPLCYLKLAGGSLFEKGKIPHWLCMCFGILVMVVSTFYSLQKIFMPPDLHLAGEDGTTVAQTCS